MQQSNRLLILSVLLLGLPVSAYAYLDPGTGSYIIQVAIALIASGLFAIKIFWKNIKEKVAQLRAKNKDTK